MHRGSGEEKRDRLKIEMASPTRFELVLPTWKAEDINRARAGNHCKSKRFQDSVAILPEYLIVPENTWKYLSEDRVYFLCTSVGEWRVWSFCRESPLHPNISTMRWKPMSELFRQGSCATNSCAKLAMRVRGIRSSQLGIIAPLNWRQRWCQSHCLWCLGFSWLSKHLFNHTVAPYFWWSSHPKRDSTRFSIRCLPNK